MTTPSHYCTVFTASVDDTILFGNNEGWNDKNTNVWFQPATETEYGKAFLDLVILSPRRHE